MPDLSIFLQPDTWLSLATLALMEIVLGIDNIVFLSILVAKLPAEKQPRVRRIGLILALVMRLGLLLAISWVMRLQHDLFTVPIIDKGFSGRDLILLVGGLFLLGKATHEIFDKLEADHLTEEPPSRWGNAVAAILLQIVVMDIVFSLDSVITAIGMAKEVMVMVIAMIIAVGVMLVFAGAIADFVNRHPSMKILALSFLILISVMLVVEGWGGHINKGYIYFAMTFALGVEIINLKLRKGRVKPVKLHEKFEEQKKASEAEGTATAERAETP